MSRFLFCIFVSSVAWADLQVFPLRILLTDKERSAQVSLRHRGSQPAQYRISTVFYKMENDGSLKVLDQVPKEEKSADDYLRFSPKEVVLEPDVEQVIRLVTRVPADLAEGEYRTHLHFESLEPESASNKGSDKKADAVEKLDEKKSQSKSKEVKTVEAVEKSEPVAELKARLALAIPVIIRKGQPSLTLKLSSLQYLKTSDQKPAFSVEMKREGSAIPFGDFEIQSISPEGTTKTIGQVNGVSSYIDQRTVTYPLLEEPVIPGKLRILFKHSLPSGEIKTITSEIELN